MNRVWIVVDETCIQCCVGLLEIPERLYQGKEPVGAVIWGGNPQELQGYFDQVVAFEANESFCDIRQRAEELEKLMQKEECDCLILPATNMGRQLAPAVAMRLQTGIVADVIDVETADGKIRMVRPAFDGHLMAVIENAGEGPVIMSARPEAFEWEHREKETEFFFAASERKKETGIRIIDRKPLEAKRDITKEKLLVSVGGGYDGSWEEMVPLAHALGGGVSVSRKVVDNGKAPRDIQVGQSGQIVSPDFYLALGIRGSVQHLTGMDRIPNILSINTNPDAPMNSYAAITVIADAKEFARALMERIERGREKLPPK